MREIIDFYQRNYTEHGRLDQSIGQLEFARTKELLARYLPPAPVTLIDIGSGPGVYDSWLVSLAHAVHLLDLVPRHTEQARQIEGIASVVRGDARALPYRTESAGAALMLGPLYHLTAREDRLRALVEARRVLRPGGVLFAAGISRYASLTAGLFTGLIDDPRFAAIVERDLRDGQHRPAPDEPNYFTTAFFHIPEELAAEVRDAGFSLELLAAVEGPMWAAPDFDARWRDLDRRSALLAFAKIVEREPALLGMSPHLMAIARRTAGG